MTILFHTGKTKKIKEIIDFEKAEAQAGGQAYIDFLKYIKLSVGGILKTGKESKETIRNILSHALVK
ncbi:MAG: hypothetical protein HQK92_09275 [Nitrospirae bacterium]|nr:hypothetical protein [Nitrospirota bacterium]